MKLGKAAAVTLAAVLVVPLGAAGGCGLVGKGDDGGSGSAGTGSARAGSSSSSGSATRPTTVAPGVDPFTLPADQRPVLFDPCTEIPADALRAAGFGPEQKDEQFTIHKDEELKSCGWEDSELLLTVASSWRSRSVVEKTGKFEPRQTVEIAGSRRTLVGNIPDPLNLTCNLLLYTSRGSLTIATDLKSSLHEFRGQRLGDSCDALQQVVTPLIDSLPNGDYK